MINFDKKNEKLQQFVADICLKYSYIKIFEENFGGRELDLERSVCAAAEGGQEEIVEGMIAARGGHIKIIGKAEI
jgi:hypothetical protein